MEIISKIHQLFRETFPKREHKLMRIEYIAAIEEFNEYFPKYAVMMPENYRKMKMICRSLRPSFSCLKPMRYNYAAAFSIDELLDEWLEKNPQLQKPGLNGEWAISIFADHNEYILQKYREYKSQRLEKITREYEKRTLIGDDLILKNGIKLRRLLGREGYKKYINERKIKS